MAFILLFKGLILVVASRASFLGEGNATISETGHFAQAHDEDTGYGDVADNPDNQHFHAFGLSPLTWECASHLSTGRRYTAKTGARFWPRRAEQRLMNTHLDR